MTPTRIASIAFGFFSAIIGWSMDWADRPQTRLPPAISDAMQERLDRIYVEQMAAAKQRAQGSVATQRSVGAPAQRLNLSLNDDGSVAPEFIKTLHEPPRTRALTAERLALQEASAPPAESQASRGKRRRR